ncbi:MAG: AAA family ATPase [Candidatus Thermoplasmatota archaeon]|nr:AAA family ATPase [Candidatus Thermoplasmatota archaeon]
MLTHRQLAILAHLSNFGSDLEGSWDVPRGLSLVGIAENLGVVRSALNPPLKALEEGGYISTRTAHVMGSNRRRKVVHVTQSGREASASHYRISTDRGALIGPIPDLVNISGREDDISSITEASLEGNSILLEGLPGIGKTSLAVSVCNEIAKTGWTVRWATANTDSDPRSIGSMWIGDNPPSSIESISSKLDSKRTILILDEAQEISERHISSVKALVEKCSNTSAVVLVVTRAPNPFGEISGFMENRLEGLDPEEAVSLLPEELAKSSALEICRAMDGHPLAIKLWNPDDELPGSGAVQEFVEKTVIRRLSVEGSTSLDELSISPLPLRMDELFEPEGADELDDSAILRWTSDLVEPHHLVRNVRRAAWSDEEVTKMHSEQAEKWSSRKGPRALRIEAHHRLSSEELRDTDWIIDNIGSLSSEDSSAAAVVLEQATRLIEEERLFEMAADVALERGEAEFASMHIGRLEDGPNRKIRESRLARIEGDYSKANEIENEAISLMPPSVRARAKISSLVRRYDDRLPGPIDSELAISILSEVNSVELSALSIEDREMASLAIDILKHSISLETGDLEEAARSRDSLEERLGPRDPRITSLDIKARLVARADGPANAEAMQSARHQIESSESPLERIKIIHMALEASSPEHPEWLLREHSDFLPSSLREDLPSHRRVSSHWWYWRGVLEPRNRLSNWNEAIIRLRNSECSEAAKELTSRLAKEL